MKGHRDEEQENRRIYMASHAISKSRALVVGVALALALALTYLLGATTLAQAAPAPDEKPAPQATGAIVEEVPAAPVEEPAAPVADEIVREVPAAPDEKPAPQATGAIVEEVPAAPVEEPAAPVADDEPAAAEEPVVAAEVTPLTTYAPLETGWAKTTDGQWQYFDANGNAIQGLQTIEGKTYFFYEWGYMASDDWENVNGYFYFFKPTAPGEKAPALANGIKRPKEREVTTTIWQNGKEVEKKYTDGLYYLFDKAGRMLTGFRKVGSKYYYFATWGAMQEGVIAIRGQLRRFVDTSVYGNGPAALVTRLTADAYYTHNYKGKLTDVKRYDWYLSSKTGVVFSGWRKIASKWYYFEDGKMISGFRAIGGQKYYFKGGINTRDGKAPMATGLFKTITSVDEAYYQDGLALASYSWYSAGSDGALASGWLKKGKNWYYFNPSSYRMVSGHQYIDAKDYYFNQQNVEKGGAAPLVTKLTKVKTIVYEYDDETDKYTAKTVYQWHNANADGTVKIGWLKKGASTFYFDTWGYMVNGWNNIEGKTYYFKLNEKTGTAAALLNGIKVIKEKEYDYWDSVKDVPVYKEVPVYYFFDKNGVNKSGWQQDAQKNYYYFAPQWYSYNGNLDYYGSGAPALTDTTQWINGKDYTFDKDGKLTSPTKP
jgi:glucan-binding YG repeat protein